MPLRDHAWRAVRALVNLGPYQVPRLHTITLDIRVVLATAAVAILAGLLFGLAPAISASTTNLRRNRPRGTLSSPKSHSRSCS